MSGSGLHELVPPLGALAWWRDGRGHDVSRWITDVDQLRDLATRGADLDLEPLGRVALREQERGT